MNTDMSVFIVHMSVFTCHSGVSLAYLDGMNIDMETMNTMSCQCSWRLSPYKKHISGLIQA